MTVRIVAPLTALLIALLLSVPPVAASATGDPLADPHSISAQDRTFMSQNAHTNLAEIGLGSVAEDRVSSSRTREIASMVVADHRKAQDRLTALAAKLGISLPDSPDAMQEQTASTVKSHSGKAFDEAYLQAQVPGHEKSIEHARTEIGDGSDAAVIAFAKSYLPVAQKHLREYRRAVATFGASTDDNSSGDQTTRTPQGGAATGSGSTENSAAGELWGLGTALLAGSVISARVTRRPAKP
jgi:putative membrane protein